MFKYLKRLFVVTLVVIYSVLSVNSATAGTVEDTLKANMKQVYKKALSLAGRSDFDGLCGLCTGRQLQAAGVFNKYVGSNGNDSYSKYKSSKPTSGLSVTVFPGKYQSGSYTIKQICNLLNDVNINGENTYTAFCFDTGWGDDGKKYGHVLLVHAVYNGYVYWGESFGATTRVDTIANFASYYAENSKGEKRFDGAVAFGYKELQENLNIPVSSIVINGNYDLDLYVGESWQPYVEVLPANATNKAYTLSSTDSSVAQVDSNGMVYAVGPGECWVIANANDGSGVSGWMRVIVRALYVPAEQIVINSGYNAQLAQGDWWYPAVDVYPSNATNKAYHLESDNPSVARVYDDGWVEAVSTGTCMIYAVTNDYSLVSGIVLEVYEPFIPVTEIIFENGMYGDVAYTGDSRFLLDVEVYPLNATNPTYTIISSDPDVASISYFGYDEGKHYWRYTCNAPGTALISAVANDGSGVSASFWLYVLDQTVPVESIVVTNERNHLSHGEPYDILWEVYPANATNKDVTWTNSNDGVVWLLTAEEGFVEVYCVGCGDTVITVSANDGSGVYYSFPLTVDHVYKEVTTTNPTCTAAGVKTFNCIGCAHSYTESIAAVGHQEGERIVVTEPSATAPGTAWICCKNCGGIIRTEEIPALGVPRIPGDANADGYVDRFDALTILQYDAGGAVAINLSNADVNADGSADIYDALLLLQYLAGWNVMLK